ncbi:hypothetical protein WJX73_010626 [Symbiochloris irregularis]|uniref:Protein kinase domain-containing protein n=1 Tax=Symbiochloris irregularis TaxID=706552 RepID=A0AAW1Q067_9CHLO
MSTYREVDEAGAHTTRRDARASQPEEGSTAISVPDSFAAKPGVGLADGVLIGKLLGQGLQGAVFELTDSQGLQIGWVLKTVTAGPAAAFNFLFPGIQREWLIGRELCLTLNEGPLLGFMRTGASIKSQKSGKIRGIVIEQMSGNTLDKHLLQARQGCLDAKYIRSMLQQVFMALDGAQKAAGFVHWDLRLANVMQHNPGACSKAAAPPTIGAQEATEAAVQQSDGPTFKMIDFGHGNLYDRHLKAIGVSVDRDKRVRLPRVPATEVGYRLFWHREGDVFRLLMSLQNVIDGCCWPRAQAPLVRQLAGLIRHVTGIQLKIWLQEGDQVLCDSRGMPWHRQGGCCNILRRCYIRTRSFWFPSTPRITAAEALSHPLFTEPAC